MKISMIAGALALTFGSAQAWADAANPLDAQFAALASVGNSFEMASSKLALRHASGREVVAFARMMIADHGMAQSQLDRAAAASGSEAGLMLDPDHQKMLEDLSARSGADFDEAYVADQLAAHQEAERTLSDYMTIGEDPGLRQYANDTLPVVETHLRRIRGLSAM